MEGKKTSDALRLVLEDSNSDGATPPPLSSTHKVWFPKSIAKLIKYYLLPFVWLDNLAERVAKKIINPPFKRVGACKKRGNCCHHILLPHIKGVPGKFVYWWYTQVHGFFPRFKEPKWYQGKRVHVMGCRYLQKDGSCGQYRLRPIVCRKWPFIERFARPELLRGCGFSYKSTYEESLEEAKKPCS